MCLEPCQSTATTSHIGTASSRTCSKIPSVRFPERPQSRGDRELNPRAILALLCPRHTTFGKVTALPGPCHILSSACLQTFSHHGWHYVVAMLRGGLNSGLSSCLFSQTTEFFRGTVTINLFFVAGTVRGWVSKLRREDSSEG